MNVGIADVTLAAVVLSALVLAPTLLGISEVEAFEEVGNELFSLG